MLNIKFKLEISILSLRLSTGVGKLDHRKGKLDIKLDHHLGKVDSPPGKLDIKLDNPMGKLDNRTFQTRQPDGQTRQPRFSNSTLRPSSVLPFVRASGCAFCMAGSSISRPPHFKTKISR